METGSQRLPLPPLLHLLLTRPLPPLPVHCRVPPVVAAENRPVDRSEAA